MTEALQRQETALDSPEHQQLDELERRMLASGAPVIDLPLIHRFTPGLYMREIFMPAGTLLTSKIHMTEHPFVILTGRVSVRIIETGVTEHFTAPHVGVTRPGTRRLLYIHEDCRWITFHPIGEDEFENVPAIESRIIQRRQLADGFCAADEYKALLRDAGVPEIGAGAIAGIIKLAEDTEGVAGDRKENEPCLG